MKIEIDVKDQDIADLLCSGMEGGINYWSVITGFRTPDEFPFRFDPERVYRHVDYPMNPGGFVELGVTEGKVKGLTEFTLDRRSLEDGLRVMAEKYPRHFGNFISGNADAETGDVFIQCALFGEVVFG